MQKKQVVDMVKDLWEMKEAKRVGGGISIQSLLVLVILYEIFSLIRETRGDFANGVLFFIDELLNPFEIIRYAVLFSATYFLGRNAGREIITQGRNFVWVGLKYSLVVLGLLWATWRIKRRI